MMAAQVKTLAGKAVGVNSGIWAYGIIIDIALFIQCIKTGNAAAYDAFSHGIVDIYFLIGPFAGIGVGVVIGKILKEGKTKCRWFLCCTVWLHGTCLYYFI